MNTTQSPIMLTSQAPEQSDGGELGALGRVLQRDWKIVLATTALVTLGSMVQLMLHRPVPRYASEMMIQISSQSTVRELLAMQGMQPSSSADIEAEITLMRSPVLINKAIQNLPPGPEFEGLTFEQVVGNLAIQQAGRTGVLVLRYQAPTPVQAQTILTTLGQTYTKYSLARQKSKATEAIRLIEKKLPETGMALNQAASDLRNFREANRLSDPDTLAGSLIGQQESLQARYQEGLIAYKKTYTQYKDLEQQLSRAGQEPRKALLYITLSQDPVYQELMAKHTELEVEHVMNRSRFADATPFVEEVAAQKAFVKKAMGQRANQVLGQAAKLVDLDSAKRYDPDTTMGDTAAQLLTLQRDLAAQDVELRGLETALTEIDGDFQRVPRLQQQYSELQREVNSQGEAMDFLKSSLQDLEVAEVQDSSPWQILQPSTEPKPVPDPKAPTLPRNLIMGLVGGFVMGSGLGLLRQRLDNTFHSPEELKEESGLPLLGIVPLKASSQAGAPRLLTQVLGTARPKRNGVPESGYYARSGFVEAFRTLNTSLQMLSPDRPVRSLVVTSASPAEGKSTVATELAMASASMGLQVLLVDLDLRLPRQAERLDLLNHTGFSTLVNSDQRPQDWKGANAHRLQPNLTVLTSGPHPPDPTRMLSSEKTKGWLKQFVSTYDLVIYDAPPLLGLADSLLIAPATDGLLLVVKMKQTTRTALSSAIDTLKPANIPILGVVANGYSLPGVKNYYAE
jgi:succinoglycan biosynthesis transport protein ExoP